jgi:hypothetical protein
MAFGLQRRRDVQYLEDLEQCDECGQNIPPDDEEYIGPGMQHWSLQDFRHMTFDVGYTLCGDCVVDVADGAADLGLYMCDACGAFGSEEDLDPVGSSYLLFCEECGEVLDAGGEVGPPF